MTGGLQDQVTDGENWFGVGLQPSSKAIIGSQEVPYIYEDRLSKEDFLEGLLKLYNMTPQDRAQLGVQGRKWTQKRFNFDTFAQQWDDLLTHIHETCGSWETRVNYKPYEVKIL